MKNVDFELETFYFSKLIDNKEVTVEVEYTVVEGTIAIINHNVYYSDIPMEIVLPEEKLVWEIELAMEVGL